MFKCTSSLNESQHFRCCYTAFLSSSSSPRHTPTWGQQDYGPVNLPKNFRPFFEFISSPSSRRSSIWPCSVKNIRISVKDLLTGCLYAPALAIFNVPSTNRLYKRFLATSGCASSTTNLSVLSLQSTGLTFCHMGTMSTDTPLRVFRSDQSDLESFSQ